jgi:hypothetical protein
MVAVLRVSRGVLGEHLRRVEFGVEGNAEQLHACRAIGRFGECLLYLAKVVRHQRAEIWDRAAREDEGDEQRLAGEGGSRDLSPLESIS